MVIFDRILQKTFWAHFEVELSFHYSIAKINSIMNNKKYRHWFFQPMPVLSSLRFRSPKWYILFYFDAYFLSGKHYSNPYFHVVKVFNEDYVNSYLFQGDEFLDDSFQVFLKSDKCDSLAAQIERMLEELQDLINNIDAIHNLIIYWR